MVFEIKNWREPTGILSIKRLSHYWKNSIRFWCILWWLGQVEIENRRRTIHKSKYHFAVPGNNVYQKYLNRISVSLPFGAIKQINYYFNEDLSIILHQIIAMIASMQVTVFHFFRIYWSLRFVFSQTDWNIRYLLILCLFGYNNWIWIANAWTNQILEQSLFWY